MTYFMTSIIVREPRSCDRVMRLLRRMKSMSAFLVATLRLSNL